MGSTQPKPRKSIQETQIVHKIRSCSVHILVQELPYSGSADPRSRVRLRETQNVQNVYLSTLYQKKPTFSSETVQFGIKPVRATRKQACKGLCDALRSTLSMVSTEQEAFQKRRKHGFPPNRKHQEANKVCIPTEQEALRTIWCEIRLATGGGGQGRGHSVRR